MVQPALDGTAVPITNDAFFDRTTYKGAFGPASVAADWAPYGVTVNAIAPGAFMTDANRRWISERPELKTEAEALTTLEQYRLFTRAENDPRYATAETWESQRAL